MPRESIVEAHLVKRVKQTGGYTRKAQWVGRWGCPDRWCGWENGRHGWVELKGDGGKLSVHQLRELEMLRSCGETTYVLSSIEEVDLYIHQMTDLPLGMIHLL